MGILTSIIDRTISGSFSSDLFFNVRDFAFYSCSNLTSIYVGTNTSTVCTLSDTGAFDDCTNLTSIYVPANLVDSYKSATNWSSYADKIKATP